MDRRIYNIIEKFYPAGSAVHKIYLDHGTAVTELSKKIAWLHPELGADLEVIEYCGMLHDIGILFTDAPEILCFGDLPYLAHGYKGRELLENENLPQIAPVCERHIGVGITLEDIIKHNLPLPQRDMTPQTIEEKIVCYADKFYSKSANKLLLPKPFEKVKKSVSKYGPDKWKVFEEMMHLFGTEMIYS
jgi:uncharacterized protein